MVRTSEAAARDPTRGETAIQEFANCDLTSEQLKQRATLLLNSKRLLQSVQGLAPENQMRFMDKVDQVCQDGPLLALDLSIIFEGISDNRLAQREIYRRLGARV